MKIISRKDARAQNHNTYFTGKACKNGHISYRYTTSGVCYECVKRARIEISRNFKAQLSEITTRAQAKAAKSDKYFTGKPCKNGHISYRYTDSGTCYDCINRARIAVDSPVALARDSQFAEMATQIATKKKFLEDLVEMNLIAHPSDVGMLKAIVLGFAVGRRSNVHLGDVWLTARPKAGVRYHIKCHPEDVSLIRSAADVMYEAHRPDVEAIRKHIIGEVEREVSQDVGYDIKETFK